MHIQREEGFGLRIIYLNLRFVDINQGLTYIRGRVISVSIKRFKSSKHLGISLNLEYFMTIKN